MVVAVKKLTDRECVYPKPRERAARRASAAFETNPTTNAQALEIRNDVDTYNDEIVTEMS